MSKQIDCDCCHISFDEEVVLPFVDDQDEFSTLCPVCALQKLRKIHGDPQLVFKSERNKKKFECCKEHLDKFYNGQYAPVLID